jgi:hypothetical protein
MTGLLQTDMMLVVWHLRKWDYWSLTYIEGLYRGLSPCLFDYPSVTSHPEWEKRCCLECLFALMVLMQSAARWRGGYQSHKVELYIKYICTYTYAYIVKKGQFIYVLCLLNSWVYETKFLNNPVFIRQAGKFGEKRCWFMQLSWSRGHYVQLVAESWL